MPLWKLVLVSFIQISIAASIWGGLLFHGAGDWYWQRGFVHLGLWLVTFAINLAFLLLRGREVLEARLKRAKITQRWDKLIMFLMVPAMLAIPYVGGLDGAKVITSSVSDLVPLFIAILFQTLGDAIVVWTMLVNPFLEKGVRIQKERGHKVITTGPYAYVRHPMYLGMFFMFLAIPPVLGSRLAYVPVLLVIILLTIRTHFEDGLLFNELAGYDEYAKNTRYRLFPGIW